MAAPASNPGAQGAVKTPPMPRATSISCVAAFIVAIARPLAADEPGGRVDQPASWKADEKGAYDLHTDDLDVHIDVNGNITSSPRTRPRLQIDAPCPSCLLRQLVHDVTVWAADPDAYGRAMSDAIDADGDAGGPIGLPRLSVVEPLPGDLPTARRRYALYVPLMKVKVALGGRGDASLLLAKQRVLDGTRDRRDELAAKAHARQSLATLASLPDRLDALWRRSDLTPAARRALLFEMWDECAETGEPAEVQDGMAARAAIVAFIRRALPAGGADAYLAEELGALNRRRTSRVPFRPYGDE